MTSDNNPVAVCTVRTGWNITGTTSRLPTV